MLPFNASAESVETEQHPGGPRVFHCLGAVFLGMTVPLRGGVLVPHLHTGVHTAWTRARALLPSLVDACRGPTSSIMATFLRGSDG